MSEQGDAGTALVVDDDPTARAFLRALLHGAGYRVVAAASGEDALAHFAEHEFDVVFMDLEMPGMNGIETTRRIKAAAGEFFVPVIFVTGASDQGSLVSAMDAGGDDFLSKPVTGAVLLAKLRALQRIRALHNRTRQLYERAMAEQESAKNVFDRAVSSRTLDSLALRASLIPAEVFSGDLLLSGIAPEGRVYVLVGDFTGHGLPAALGALPVSETFRKAVAAGLAPELLLQQINSQVFEALPRGHFLAASLICIDRHLSTVLIANCGMPTILLCGPEGIRERVKSGSYALGIIANAGFVRAVVELPTPRGSRVLIATDGVSEALNAQGEAFGLERIERHVATACALGLDGTALLVEELAAFRGQAPLADDASVVEICLSEELWTMRADCA